MLPVFDVTRFCPKWQRFNIGCALPQGQYFADQQLSLCNSIGNTHQLALDNAVRANITPLQLWPDKSIKWITFDGVFVQDIQANTTLFLIPGDTNLALQRKQWISTQANKLKISTAQNVINIDTKQLLSMCVNNLSASKPLVKTQLDYTLATQFNSLETSLGQINHQHFVHFDQFQQPLSCDVFQQAEVLNKHEHVANFNIKHTICYHSGQIYTWLRLHNPKAIEHNNGQWDLGNPNSIYIRQLATSLHFHGESVSATVVNDSNQSEDARTLINCEHINIAQTSSGGKHWNSPVHKNSHNEINVGEAQASVQYTNEKAQTEVFSIPRANPQIRVDMGSTQLLLQAHYFWQTFPTVLEASTKQAQLCFVPPNQSDDQVSHHDVELQPGETKSHHWCLAVAATKTMPVINAAKTEHGITLHAQTAKLTGAFGFNCGDLETHPLHKILLTTDAWFDKREALDEYGWRNFGDLYADHEAAQHKGDEPFVSHYNNQYDPLLGFLQLWILSGKPAYKTLADDLCQHIVNIDIYNTTLDKPEYNQGLFWHTDHYLQAETATHRTYSKLQPNDVYMDHAGGGGPGTHHCYSSGLAQYYLLTGNVQAKQAVLGLCQWMQRIHEGDGTLLGLLLRIRNSNYLRVPLTNKLIFGYSTVSVRNVFTNQYPLDRGTGNYVNVLLDCFEITAQQHYLRHAEYVICNTITALDNIAERHFDDVENTWFYTVLLQAVIKYLRIMYQQDIETTNSVNIRAAFLHYARYITEHEDSYLANPDVLEYPNDTWTGQDLRKLHILFAAHAITHSEPMESSAPTSSIFNEKASTLSKAIYQGLNISSEAHYTRIQALIMQNISDQTSINTQFTGYQDWYTAITPKVSMDLKQSLLKRMLSFIANYSFKREYTVLCARFVVLTKIFSSSKAVKG